ncbi:archaeal proteasome endopeptidase complex subunit alpha [Candidatus Woesearchaeota archaeon]|nr:archaeal proteasome endopeptidase complex subunit alpha [Candidatus Woesearchaeota archaeon]
MQPLSHQVMGYDRAITMFSPDGRLLQVEYAKKTVKQGSTAIGIVYKDGVLLATDKRIVDPLVVPESVEKIFKVDDHIAATAAGILSDARVLIDRARIKSQQHMVTYDAPIDILSVVKDICNLKQLCTQSGGLRPFGVSILIAGVDNGTPKLYETDPTGIYFQYKATIIGEGEGDVEETLHKEYRPDLSLEDALRLAVLVLSKVLDKSLVPERIDCAYINVADKKLVSVSREDINRLCNDIKKGKK